MATPWARPTPAASYHGQGAGAAMVQIPGVHRGIVISADMEQMRHLTTRLYRLSILQQALSFVLMAVITGLALGNLSTLFTIGMLSWLLCCSAPMMAGLTCAGMQGWVSITAKDRLGFARFVSWNRTCVSCWVAEMLLTLGMVTVALVGGGSTVQAQQASVVVGLNLAVVLIQAYTTVLGRQLLRMPLDSVWHLEVSAVIPVAHPVVATAVAPVQPPPLPAPGAGLPQGESGEWEDASHLLDLEQGRGGVGGTPAPEAPPGGEPAGGVELAPIRGHYGARQR